MIYNTSDSAAFAIKHQQHEIVRNALIAFQKTYPEPRDQAIAAAGMGNGFLYGVKWFAETVFKAIERDGLCPDDGPEVETFHLIEAGVSATDDCRINPNEIIARSVQ